MANGSRLAATYLAYRRRAETCSYPPTRVWVEAASHCNLQCAFCGNRLLSEEQRGFMDFDLFRRLADEASGVVPRFNLFHRGESLLHPRIGDMVRYAESKGIRTRINTNGMLLDR
ncbi:MAG: radical SAM protein, partial [Armatimonadetes bacterium]|nr:radical SAM protein [Armatimonadota bacterium]